MRSSHKTVYANQLIDNLIKAAEMCDPTMINEFFSLTFEANVEHLNLIEDNLSLEELIHKQHVISQGAILLALFNHFATRQVQNGLSEFSIPLA